jgi:hypothetical protein
MNTMTDRRTGMALPMVLGAIVLIGTLITGVMFLATQDYRVGANTLNEARAEAVAEMGLNHLTTDWDLSKNTSMQPGDTLRKSYADPSGATADVFVTRLYGPFFWAVSQAQTRGNSLQYGSRRRYGTLLRLNTPDIPFMAALTGRGTVKVGGSALVDGNDHDLGAGYNCPPKSANLAGVAMSDTNSAILPGCSVAKNCISGNPKFLQSAAAADTATYFQYGNSNYTELAKAASIVIPAGANLSGAVGPIVTGGVCDKSMNINWGDAARNTPAGVCEGYLPVIHALGDLKVTGGSGQGILLVDGDLNMSGNFWFVGIIIVRGTVSSTGTGAHIYGGVLAANVDLDGDQTVIGNSYIYYSSCALYNVTFAAAYPVIAKGRAWVNLY